MPRSTRSVSTVLSCPPCGAGKFRTFFERLADGGHLTISVEAALAEMRQLPIAIDDEISGLFGGEAALSKQHGLSVYDAAYLKVALRRRLPLATIDKKLAAAAKVAGASF